MIYVYKRNKMIYYMCFLFIRLAKLQVDVTRVAHDAAAGASLHRMAAEISLESHGYAPWLR